MTLDQIKEHVHYCPSGQPVVCGFGLKVVEADARGETKVPHAILKVQSKTDVRKVTCPACLWWIYKTVSAKLS